MLTSRGKGPALSAVPPAQSRASTDQDSPKWQAIRMTFESFENATGSPFSGRSTASSLHSVCPVEPWIFSERRDSRSLLREEFQVSLRSSVQAARPSGDTPPVTSRVAAPVSSRSRPISKDSSPAAS